MKAKAMYEGTESIMFYVNNGGKQGNNALRIVRRLSKLSLSLGKMMELKLYTLVVNLFLYDFSNNGYISLEAD